MKTKLLLLTLSAFWHMKGAQIDAKTKEQLRKAVQDTHSYSPTARGDASKALNYLLSTNTRLLEEPDDQTLRALKKYGFAGKYTGRVYPAARAGRRFLRRDQCVGYQFLLSRPL